jgi:hypothetical protein
MTTFRCERLVVFASEAKQFMVAVVKTGLLRFARNDGVK